MSVAGLLKRESKDIKTSLLVTAVLSATSEVALLVLFQSSLFAPGGFDMSFLFKFKFVLLLLLFLFFTRQAYQRTVSLVSTMTSSMRERIIEKVRKMELAQYETISKPYIYNCITLDLENIGRIVDKLFLTIGNTLITIGCLIYLAWISPKAFVISMVCTTACVMVYTYMQAGIKRRIELVRKKEKYFIFMVEHLLYGFKELKINDKKNDDFFHLHLKKNIREIESLNIKAGARFTDVVVICSMLWLAMLFLITFVLPASGYFSHQMLVMAIPILLFMPVMDFLLCIQTLMLADISSRRICNLEKLLEKLIDESDGGGAPSLKTPQKTDCGSFKTIRYENMTFSYTDKAGTPVFSLKKIDLSVNAGEILFITGGNGGGKSTLLKLITGLYFPLSGSVYLDGKPVDNTELRELFSPIFTDFHLFDRLYGQTDIDAEKVNDLIKLMRLEDKTQFVEDRFTNLDLSSGQRKRLALIVALNEDKPVHVFDEWAADQDPDFRAYFYYNLLPSLKRKGKTVVAVTHDDQYFHAADRIVRLDYGELSEKV